MIENQEVPERTTLVNSERRSMHRELAETPRQGVVLCAHSFDSMKYKINDFELNVCDQGQGEQVLFFLHYWGGSSRTLG
jgi:hypothetical protein